MLFCISAVRSTLCCCVFAIAVYGQPHQLQFVRQFGPTVGAVSDIASATASRGGFHVVAGRTNGAFAGETNAGASDIFVRKYNESGNLLWSRQFGSAGDDSPTGVAIDSAGNIIVAGTTCGVLPGQFSAGDCDVFLRKFDAAGATSWTRQFGTLNREFSGKVAVDGSGNIAFAGTTRGSFLSFTISGFNDAFVTRYDAAGNQLWLKQFGTTGSDEANGIGIDGGGFIVACGGVDGSLNGQTALGASDGFLTKLDTAGATQWTAQFGSSDGERCVDLSIDPSGGIYAVLSGALRQFRQFTSAGAPVSIIGFGPEITGIAADATGVSIVGFTPFATLEGQANAGGNDAYVRRYNTAGGGWTDLFGTTDSESALAISTHGTKVFIAGHTNGVLPGEAANGLGDGFVRQYSIAGTEEWTDQFGGLGPATSFGAGVHVTATRIFTAGQTNGAMPGNTHLGDSDGYLSAHDINGNTLWIRQFGSNTFDTASAVGADAAGNVYVAGYTSGMLPGAARTGDTDGFLKKFDAAGNEIWTVQFGTELNGIVQVNGLVADAAGNVYVAGNATLAFPGKSNSGDFDAFVRKYSSAGFEVWTRQFGTSSSDYAFGIALDGAGGIVAAGQTSGFLGQEKFGNADGFVGRLDAGGNITWLTQIGVGAGQIASLDRVTVGADGSIYAAGSNTGAYPGQAPAGAFDISLAKLSSAGALSWVRQFGGSSSDRGVGVAVDASANISVVGSLGNTAVSDTAIRRFNPDGAVLGTLVHSTPNTDLTFAGAANADGVIVATGYTQSAFSGQTQFGLTDVFIKQFLPPNSPPTVAANAASIAANEGSLASNSGTFGDPNPGDTVTLSASPGTVTKTGAAAWSWSGTAVEGPSVQTVTITANDGRGGISTATFQLAIANRPPVLGVASGPSAPVAAGASANVAAPVSDPGVLDPITCRFQWDDGSADTVNAAASGACSAAHIYAAAGVYTVTIIANDDDGGSASTVFAYVIVYDPSTGFVTGGGWIQSLAGAYIADPTLAGRANFGFVSRYQKGASTPTGQTEFHFQAGSFRFESTSYEWLVIAGARAQYKGSGNVNGVAGYGFLLTAIDGQINGGGGVDKFRIKVWRKATATTPETLVYDNVLGAPDTVDGANPQAIGGGSITIHTK
ncbi:MAG: SBBP repeat-containing protein [Acidobacteria bacterium]|nr:SBBP repeat-containing protein [Acidobacteriota bacterium]